MENLESKNLKDLNLDKNFISNKLGLVADEVFKSSPSLKLQIDSQELNDLETRRKPEKKSFNNPDELFEQFEGISVIKPDKITRSTGDTTFFTSAGVQHIETIFKDEGDLRKEKFIVAQPVIRSQFMDKVKDGTSTSFINLSVESIDANPAEFIKLSNEFIKLVVNQGIDPKELRFCIDEISDRWGDKKFHKTVLTLYFNNIELGECVYMHDYPVKEDKKIDIVDIGFGIERLNWGINNKNYFPDFDKFYTSNIDSNKITAIIDAIRTAVLIAGEGVAPSNHDHGYRLRQLSKRFISRDVGVNLDFRGLIDISYEYWKRWGAPFNLDKEEILKIISQENERNWNSLFLLKLKEYSDFDIRVNINQKSTDFLQQINASLPKEAKTIVDKIIKEIK
jgi:hypothetical protein